MSFEKSGDMDCAAGTHFDELVIPSPLDIQVGDRVTPRRRLIRKFLCPGLCFFIGQDGGA